MKTEVRYFSKSGNTKKLADAIAEAAGCRAQSIPAPLDGYTDMLFLGAAVYAGGISAEVKAYIRTLNPNQVGTVAVFSTSALAQRAFPQIQKELQARGIPVCSEDFYCRGQFHMLFKGRPGEADLHAVKAFAKKLLRDR